MGQIINIDNKNLDTDISVVLDGATYKVGNLDGDVLSRLEAAGDQPAENRHESLRNEVAALFGVDPDTFIKTDVRKLAHTLAVVIDAIRRASQVSTRTEKRAR